MSSAWNGDWKKRLEERVLARGHGSVAEFARANPTATFLQLAEMLGPDVAAVQLEWTLRPDPGDAAALERFARDCCVREIRGHLAGGWDTADGSGNIGAYGAWANQLPDFVEDAVERVWDALDELAPKGWLPEGPDDPVLLKAFERWNAGT